MPYRRRTSVTLALLLAMAAFAPSQARADICSNPPSTADLRVAIAVVGKPVTIQAPSGLYPGCDVEGDPITATFDWGDGTIAPATITPTGPGRFSVVGTHTYSRAGEFDIDIAQTNHRTDVVRHDRHYNAHVARPVRVKKPIRASAGEPFEGVIAKGTWGPSRHRTNVTAWIDWGDGKRSRVDLVPDDDGRFAIRARHVWSKPRAGRVKVRVALHGKAGSTLFRTSRKLVVGGD